MMDAVVVLKTIESMCRSYVRCSDGCPLYGICIWREQDEGNPELIIAAVEEWRKEHPAKTRQSEFLKMFPRADMPVGIINIKPCEVDIEVYKGCGNFDSCWPCMRKYWLEEVE